jgi:hypothetical protein
LVAEGTNLKWFLNELDIKSYATLTPSTEKENVTTYYVSQTNIFGCESVKAKTIVTVGPLATATISGDRTMFVGDSTLLNVSITGEFPVNFTLSDGRSFVANNHPYILEVRPLKSTTYALKEVRNACGLGTISGSAKIIVLEPLAGEEPLENIVKVFPNPTSELLIVEFLAVQSNHTSISLCDLNGRILQEKSIKTVGTQQEIFGISQYSAGNYFLKINIDKVVLVKKVVINR